MSACSLTLEAAEKAAAAKGLVVVIPKANELFVDIDSAEDFAVFEKHVERLQAASHQELGCAVLDYRVTPSNSGGERRHAVVTLSRDVKSDVERCLLQACLGSDRLRELLSWVRIESGVRVHPTVFFERPAANVEEVSW